MKELEQILELWAELERAGESAVLATVVETRGSSYRLPGARLLLTSTGRHAGSISGGCLEEDLLKKAWWLTQEGPVIRRYDTTPDGEIAGEFGLGCNGVIHVLLERISPGNAPVLGLIRAVRAQRRSAVITHVTEPLTAAGQRLIVDTNGKMSHNLADGLPASGRKVFIETLAPAVRLLIFGAGDDAVPLTTLARFLGWRVSVFDGRAHYARASKFPDADEVLVRPAGQSGMAAAIDPWTVAVLMSHSYSQDLATLRELAPLPLPYLGILGPQKRTGRLLADAGLDAGSLLPALHGPMGLDIGADGPQQVALAVIAEIQTTLNGREGGLLRERSGSIHAAEDAAAQPEKLWVQSIACA